jgi:hypothetical protein
METLRFCGVCGKPLERTEVLGEFDRYTGVALTSLLCPQNHEGWKLLEQNIYVELRYDEDNGTWYEVKNGAILTRDRIDTV